MKRLFFEEQDELELKIGALHGDLERQAAYNQKRIEELHRQIVNPTVCELRRRQHEANSKPIWRTLRER